MRNNKFFKVFSFLLVLVIAFFIVGCENNNVNNGNDNNDNNQEVKPDENIEVPTYDKDLKIYFINVGQGDCQLCMLPNGMNVLIDAGLDNATCFGEANFPSWDNIKKVFDLENIKTIDYFIITHNHMDHYKYATTIINNYTVKNMVLSGSTSTNYTYKEMIECIEYNKINTIIPNVGDMLIEDKELTMQVVSTQKIDNPKDCNICSVCTKLIYNKISILSMGDAGMYGKDGYPNGEEIAMKSNIDLKSTVLKVGHHGSSKSSGYDFLAKVRPEYAVITTSKVTSTGHPHRSAMERITSYTTNVYQTKDDGTILLTSNGKELTFSTHIGE